MTLFLLHSQAMAIPSFEVTCGMKSVFPLIGSKCISTSQFLDWLVAQTKHPSLVSFRIRQLKPGLIPFLKETLSLPQDQRSNMQRVLIDKVMLYEQPNQVRAPLDQENPTGLRFQLRYFFRNVICNDIG